MPYLYSLLKCVTLNNPMNKDAWNMNFIGG